jgi:DNA ligase-associated metallophosphoesterase
MTDLEIVIAGERLQLMAERAMYWPRKDILFVTDLHLGKAAAFRAAGIPVPEMVTKEDLSTLGRLLEKTNARRLVILGDLFHAKAGMKESTMDAFFQWRIAHGKVRLDLIEGNHDAKLGKLPGEWRLDIHKTLDEPPFRFAHEPATFRGSYGLFGHVHPAVQCAGMRLPCFQFGAAGAVLPAFGSFTGTHPVVPVRGDRVFVINKGEIAELPGVFLR